MSILDRHGPGSREISHSRARETIVQAEHSLYPGKLDLQLRLKNML